MTANLKMKIKIELAKRNIGWRLLYVCELSYLKALRKNLCKFKNCDKSDILERLKNNRSNFFTVYNGYCNLSRFFGYQPAGMERSGMESG